jgi:hypothetical protein
LLETSRLFDKCTRASENCPYRTAQTFREVDPHRIKWLGVRPGRDASGDDGVQEACPVQVGDEPVAMRHGTDGLQLGQWPDGATTHVMGVFQLDDATAWEVRTVGANRLFYLLSGKQATPPVEAMRAR